MIFLLMGRYFTDLLWIDWIRDVFIFSCEWEDIFSLTCQVGLDRCSYVKLPFTDGLDCHVAIWEWDEIFKDV